MEIATKGTRLTCVAQICARHAIASLICVKRRELDDTKLIHPASAVALCRPMQNSRGIDLSCGIYPHELSDLFSESAAVLDISSGAS